MKVDPNQKVGGIALPTDYGVDFEHVGGIPLRLEIASRVLAGSMGGSMIGLVDCSKQVGKNAVEYALLWADALIAAHNATCEAEEVAEALEALVGAFEDCVDEAEGVPAYVKARAALAKAEGGPDA